MRLCALLIPVLLATACYSQDYTYWSHPQIELTNLFKIDHANKLIIVAAKNNICHLSLDLKTTLNAQNATPSATKINTCRTSNAIFESLANCQNFHHILHIPTTDTLLSLDNNQTVPLNETVLACGSDAYQPLCFYRNRTDLTLLKSYEGRNFCPFDRNSVSTSILSSNGNLVSGTSLNVRASSYGLSLSHSPFNGTASVSTINYYISFQEPEFIDVYEFGDYYYFFMRETAEEIGQVSMRPIYSRVGRVCKNDTGVTNILAPTSTKVFVTYLKARILCQSRAKSGSDFPFTFNSLQDTVHVSNVSGEYMYGAFTSSENAPAGSAICSSVYLSTSEGLYVVPLDDCERLYPTCSECISSRDPYCAYHVEGGKCVSTITSVGGSGSLLQDIVNGDSSNCPVAHHTTTVSPSPTIVTLSTVDSSAISSSGTSVMNTVQTVTSSSSTTLSSSTVSSSIAPSSSSSSYVATITTEPTVGTVNDASIEEHTWTIVAGAGGLTVGIVVGVLLFALIRNKNRFCWGKFLSRNRRCHWDDDGEKGSYELGPTKPDYPPKNNAHDYCKVPVRSTTPPLSKLNPTPKITDSPVLTKYTNTGSGRRHNRSMSHGGQFLPNGAHHPVAGSPIAGSPMGNNLRTTFHVDEPVPNPEYEKYGHNMIGRQISREYPMIMPMVTPNRMVAPPFHHAKTNSLDLDNIKF
uniref:Sema domain-containing protein n=1 Tax=Amphimedon queenslandica TaxID=400682 RepID=A0A1X7V831_AMPQE